MGKLLKKILAFGMAEVLALSATPVLSVHAGEDLVTETQIGSDVWDTPVIPAAPEILTGVKQSEISLNETTGDGTWKYLFDIPDYTKEGGVPAPTESDQDFDFRAWSSLDWKNIKVPGEALMQGYDILTNNEYYYQREVAIPSDFEGNRVIVRFDGVYCNARVWINGHYIRTHVGGFTTWDCDITDYAVPGESVTLTVGVADLYADTRGIWNPEGDFLDNPSHASAYAHHNIGGINRDVSLLALPEDCIARTYVNTDFDTSFTDADLEVTIQLRMKSKQAGLLLELLDGENNVEASGKITFVREENNTEDSELSAAKKITIPVTKPAKWDAEHPNLYTLRSTLTVGGKTIQVNQEKIGFREIHYGGREGTDRNKVYVNGKEVKLRGTCRHDVSHDLGRSMTREEAYAEARAYKNANINHIRTSHYPASEDLLDACDELGIYVEQETAVCFQGYPSSTVSSKYEDYLPQFTEMIERDRNRPSVLIWSLGNESNYGLIQDQCGGEAIWNEKTYLKDVDNSRPCIFSWPDTAPYEIADIYSKHYENVEGSMGAWDRPVLHDEFAHISCYNLDELQRDVNVRNFWGESIKKAWENIFTTDGALGGDLWGGIDDVFYIPKGTTQRWDSHSAGETAGYGEWGSVLDVYLREKPEAYLTKKAYSPIRLQEEDCYVQGETLHIPVKNWFDHTNFNELTAETVIDETTERHRISESVLPHEEGEITIPGIPKQADSVNLKFYTADGIMIDEYKIALAEIEYHYAEAGNIPPEIEETDSEIVIKGEAFSVAFDKETGLISKGEYQKETLITGGPYLHVTGMELGNWSKDPAAGILVRIENNFAVVTVKGSYENGQGVQFDIKISDNGIILSEYTLTTSPAVSSGLKEVGISYDIPDDVKSVSWLRDGLYSAYPKDHIGRNEGTALKIREDAENLPDQYGLEPTWPWKDDMKNYFVFSSGDPNDGLVTNDFKTMRENIRYYNVNYSSDADAPHISVESEEANAAARIEVSYSRTYVDDRDAAVTYTGSWENYETEGDYAGTERYSTQRGDACEFTFVGTGVRYIGSKQKNTGLVKIFLDGEVQTEIDTYSNLGNEMKQSVIYSVDGLPKGEHTIRLETAGGAADCIVVDAFEVLGTAEEGEAEQAKLIINQQWYYPNLAWGNYTGNQGILSYNSRGIGRIRLCTGESVTKETKPSLNGLTIVKSGKNKLMADYDMRNADENTKLELKWYKTAIGDPDSKVQELKGEESNILNVSSLKANRIYCTAVLFVDGERKETLKSNEIEVGPDSYTYYDILVDSDFFTFTGIKGTDYQTDANEDWTQNAYQKTVTYLLDTQNPASISFAFQGRGIRWIGAKENNQGIANVTVDEEEPVEIDLCDASVNSQNQINEILFEKSWDAEGSHRITIQRTGKKNSESLAANISLDAFIVISYEDDFEDVLDQAILDYHISEDEKDLYTQESYAQYETALKAVMELKEKDRYTQDELNQKIAALKTAYEGLQKRPGRQNNVKVKQITVSGTIKKLAKGKQAVLQADVFPANASDRKVKWSSSNPKIAAVNDSGVVTGKGKGTAVITAEAADGSGQIGTYKITVVKHAVKKISLKCKKKTVAPGKKIKVAADIKTTGKSANKKLSWTTSDPDYAVVNAKGMVTAKKAGKGKKITITARATDGTGKRASIKIKIK